MPCVYLPGPAPAVTVANTNNTVLNTLYYQITKKFDNNQLISKRILK